MAGILEERVVLVTGGAGGIGLAACEIIVAEGARLILSDNAEPAARKALAFLEDRGLSAEVMVADVTSEDSVRGLIDAILARHGRLDGAFNNAGIEHQGIGLADLALPQWDRCIAVDLTGVFLCMKHQVQAMLKTGGGAIVNNSAGMVEAAIPQAAEYIAAKHGVVGLTRSGAVEYGRAGVRVNAVLPGPIRTAMLDRALHVEESDAMLRMIEGRVPLGRVGEPREVGAAVAWLLSDQASFVNGACLPVDGGFTVA